MKNKILPLLLALIICLGIFAGCGSTDLKAYSDNSPEPSSEGNEDTTPARDYSDVFASFAPDTVMLTVDGIDITWQELFYWYYYDVSWIESNYGNIEDWDAPAAVDESQTYRQLVLEDALKMTKYYHVVETKAKEYGITLSEADKAEIDANWQSNVEQYGSEESFVEYIETTYFTKELYYKFSGITYLYKALQDEICGENGEKLSEADILAKANEDGYMRAKHILLMTVNDAQEPLSDEEIAAKRKQAQDVLAQLQGISDPAALEAKFDELVAQYGEDTGMTYYTDGYTFLPGNMVQEFEDATRALEDYQISGIVETSYGYHIILRLPLDIADAVEYYSENEFHSLAYTIAQEIFPTMHENWVEESNVVLTDTYKAMDIAALFSKTK